MYKYIKNIAIIMALCLSLEAKNFVVDCNKCVVEVGFSDEEVEYFKKEMGEEDFYVAADDANYYAYTLSKYLETNGIEFKHVARLDSHRTKLVFPNESIDIANLKWLYEYYLYQKGKSLINLWIFQLQKMKSTSILTLVIQSIPRDNEIKKSKKQLTIQNMPYRIKQICTKKRKQYTTKPIYPHKHLLREVSSKHIS